jgi:hypothetical protein
MQLDDLRSLNVDTLLGALGVQRKEPGSWVAPAIAGLAVGAVLGAAATLLLAPASAEDRRERLARRVDEALELSPAQPGTHGPPPAVGQGRPSKPAGA